MKKFYLQKSGKSVSHVFDLVDEHVYTHCSEAISHQRGEQGEELPAYSGVGFTEEGGFIQIQGEITLRDLAIIQRMCGGKERDFMEIPGGTEGKPSIVLLKKRKSVRVYNLITRLAA